MSAPGGPFRSALIHLIVWITPRCHDITRLLSREREQPLTWIERTRIRWHLGICEWCDHYREQLGLLAKWGPAFSDHDCHHGHQTLDPAARERIKAALCKN